MSQINLLILIVLSLVLIISYGVKYFVKRGNRIIEGQILDLCDTVKDAKNDKEMCEKVKEYARMHKGMHMSLVYQVFDEIEIKLKDGR